ncbi:hypothetical protein CSE16_01105 [Solibacillus sp. R5-41]|uniref:hypothetical protein n=1 Tax=Solibacillus sp. R5-41 TaxID=2048654 RepID=UPI000C125EA5|nr:hypothetical protein [Solibacillus sp. R5-41]ATP38739.1 hypothetical protein CSE16_01105 [Solibacillus sp. R5-41]
MKIYLVIITTAEDQRLHFHTNNDTLIISMHRANTQPLDIQTVKTFTSEELFIIEAYLDGAKSCEIKNNITQKSFMLP